ncbi:unnamed protein product [Effrenium voratum]|nr:unnamed protein product [Effrenium voratum]CAJ1459984.1 unnamed protein product [Effrenium voratum]
MGGSLASHAALWWSLAKSPVLGCKLPSAEAKALKAVLDGLGVEDEADQCDVRGVTCEEDTSSPGHCRVVKLSFRDSALSGTLHEAVGHFQRLRELNLRWCKVSGGLPETLGQLEALDKLTLPYNQFTGPLPRSLNKLRNLKQLDMGYNQLTGRIPRSWGELTALKQLHLGGNQLEGPVPQSLGRLENLELLRLHDNLLSGGIPETFAQLQELRRMDLACNRLEGELPAALVGRLQKLRELNLDGNRLNGSLPELGSTELRELHLGSNHLVGPLPSRWYLPRLHTLNLENNGLSGPLPDLHQQIPILAELRLGGNRLSGQIPKSFGKLKWMQTLDLSRNHFTGHVPMSCQSLHMLTQAYFYGNKDMKPEMTQVRNCAPFDVDCCKIFVYLDTEEVFTCLLAALATALGVWCLTVMSRARASRNGGLRASEVPLGALEIAAKALYPTSWWQTLYLILAIDAHLFVPLCLAWCLNPRVVFASMLLLKVLANVPGCNWKLHPLSLFFPVGLSARRRPWSTVLAELVGGAVPLGLALAGDWLQARAVFRNKHVVIVDPIRGNTIMVLTHFLPLVFLLSKLYALVFCGRLLRCLCWGAGRVPQSNLHARKLALALKAVAGSDQEVITAEVRFEQSRNSREIEMIEKPSARSTVETVRAENLGWGRLRIQSADLGEAYVQMLTPHRIFMDICVISVTSLTDLLAAKDFLQNHYVFFAFFTLAGSWCSMLTELSTWRNLVQELRLSACQGYYTDPMVALRNSERSIEGFVDLALKVYGMPWGVDSNRDFVTFVLGILRLRKGATRGFPPRRLLTQSWLKHGRARSGGVGVRFSWRVSGHAKNGLFSCGVSSKRTKGVTILRPHI